MKIGIVKIPPNPLTLAKEHSNLARTYFRILYNYIRIVFVSQTHSNPHSSFFWFKKNHRDISLKVNGSRCPPSDRAVTPRPWRLLPAIWHRQVVVGSSVWARRRSENWGRCFRTRRLFSVPQILRLVCCRPWGFLGDRSASAATVRRLDVPLPRESIGRPRRPISTACRRVLDWLCPRTIKRDY